LECFSITYVYPNLPQLREWALVHLDVEQPIHPVHDFLLGSLDHVGIYIRRHCPGRVAQHLLDVPYILAVLDQHGGEGMPRCVELLMLDAGLLQHGIILPVEVPGPDPVPVLGAKDQRS